MHHVTGTLVVSVFTNCEKKSATRVKRPSVQQTDLGLISCMDSMTTTVEYKSSDPSLQDVNIREYGHLTRINDKAAEYFYARHSSVNDFFTKRTVTRNTPSNAFKNALQDDSLLVLLGEAVNSASTEVLKGGYDR